MTNYYKKYLKYKKKYLQLKGGVKRRARRWEWGPLMLDGNESVYLHWGNIVAYFQHINTLSIEVQDNTDLGIDGKEHNITGIYKKIIDMYDNQNIGSERCIYGKCDDHPWYKHIEENIKDKLCRALFNIFIRTQRREEGRDNYVLDMGFLYFNEDKCRLMYKFDDFIYFVNLVDLSDRLGPEDDLFDYSFECEVGNQKINQPDIKVTLEEENDEENVDVDIIITKYNE